jgi:hypothetical protein
VRHAEANIWFSVDMPLRILHIAISDSWSYDEMFETNDAA